MATSSQQESRARAEQSESHESPTRAELERESLLNWKLSKSQETFERASLRETLARWQESQEKEQREELAKLRAEIESRYSLLSFALLWHHSKLTAKDYKRAKRAKRARAKLTAKSREKLTAKREQSLPTLLSNAQREALALSESFEDGTSETPKESQALKRLCQSIARRATRASLKLLAKRAREQEKLRAEQEPESQETIQAREEKESRDFFQRASEREAQELAALWRERAKYDSALLLAGGERACDDPFVVFARASFLACSWLEDAPTRLREKLAQESRVSPEQERASKETQARFEARQALWDSSLCCILSEPMRTNNGASSQPNTLGRYKRTRAIDRAARADFFARLREKRLELAERAKSEPESQESQALNALAQRQKRASETLAGRDSELVELERGHGKSQVSFVSLASHHSETLKIESQSEQERAREEIEALLSQWPNSRSWIEALLREESQEKASESLGISQQALSKRLAKLRAELESQARETLKSFASQPAK